MNQKSKNLLLIFTRNPELGKCKTRLAAIVGNQAALDIYTFLLKHTVAITEKLNLNKEVYYSENISLNDLWGNNLYAKKEQKGDDLGDRMNNAFEEGFKNGYQNIVIIGSDMHDLSQKDIEYAFKMLEKNDYVIGPAIDGGYYLLGMKSLNSQIFKNKTWGTKTVLQETLKEISDKKIKLLEERNDIDYYDDIKNIRVFDKFLNKG